ncbi:MAG: pilus assembly protein PilM [Candidatus Omnitrophica bacterium]|jgi:Tfp pilus assembly PilM family ATPase|nr:pilus assembly protein PilM [Candidatus Omnitrophota bacterium]MDD5080849.1 pilus assembly protein PilM [Candidatus Omnitrophota bacterium]
MLNKLINSFKKTQGAYWVIDINSTTFKAVFYNDNKITEIINDEKNLTANFQKLKSKDVYGSKKHVSLRGSDTIIRYFLFPKMERKATHDGIFYELNKHIPFLPNDVYFDFDILDSTNQKENAILLGVAKKKTVDLVLDNAQSLGLEIEDISLSAVNLINLVREKEEKGNCCIFDIADDATSIIILQNGIPVITRDANIGADSLLKEVIKKRNAEETLEVLEDQVTKDFWKTLTKSPEIFTKETKSTFDYFELNKGEKIDKIYLAGKIMDYPDAVDFFSSNFSANTELLNNFPFLNIEDNKKNKIFLCEFASLAGMLI